MMEKMRKSHEISRLDRILEVRKKWKFHAGTRLESGLLSGTVSKFHTGAQFLDGNRQGDRPSPPAQQPRA
jgi:hypothetical protein